MECWCKCSSLPSQEAIMNKKVDISKTLGQFLFGFSNVHFFIPTLHARWQVNVFQYQSNRNKVIQYHRYFQKEISIKNFQKLTNRRTWLKGSESTLLLNDVHESNTRTETGSYFRSFLSSPVPLMHKSISTNYKGKKRKKGRSTAI